MTLMHMCCRHCIICTLLFVCIVCMHMFVHVYMSSRVRMCVHVLCWPKLKWVAPSAMYVAGELAPSSSCTMPCSSSPLP